MADLRNMMITIGFQLMLILSTTSSSISSMSTSAASDPIDSISSSSSSSSCGNITIKPPLSLNSSPAKCGGRSEVTLHCENNETLIVCLSSRRYCVDSISTQTRDYSTQKRDYISYRLIHLVDEDIKNDNYSFIPPYSLAPYNITDMHYKIDGGPTNHYMIYLSCPSPANSAGYINITSCMKGNSSSYNAESGRYYYVNIGSETISDLGLPDLCRIDLMYPTSWDGKLGPNSPESLSPF